MMDMDFARDLAMALLIMEERPLVALDDEVRVTLGMRGRRGRLRLDDLQWRLAQLVASSDTWRLRAERARKSISGTVLTWATGGGVTLSPGPVRLAGGRG